MSRYLSFNQPPFAYANGYQISSDLVSQNIIHIAPGSIRDSTDTFQMVNTDPITVYSNGIGINGLDTGTLAANTPYYLYLIGDAFSGLPFGAIFSANATQPLLPSGYNIFKIIGYLSTDNSANFRQAFWSGDNSERICLYGAQIKVLDGGFALTVTTVPLNIGTVPLIDNVEAILQLQGAATAANIRVAYSPFGANGNTIVIQTSAVSSYSTLVSSMVTPINSVTGYPSFQYQWLDAAAGHDATVYVIGYRYTI